VALIVLGALTMRQGGFALFTIGIALVVIANTVRKSGSLPSRPTSFGDAARGSGILGVHLPPVPFTPVPGRPVMTGTFCSQCGTQGRSNASCCRRCGAGKAAMVVQPFQETHCPNCGQTHTAPIERFCRRCGQSPA
jgi:hypothetical protein